MEEIGNGSEAAASLLLSSIVGRQPADQSPTLLFAAETVTDGNGGAYYFLHFINGVGLLVWLD